MMLQKDKKVQLKNNLKTSKTIKPFSILSLGFIGQQDKNKSNRNRSTFDQNTHTKSSSTFFKNEN